MDMTQKDFYKETIAIIAKQAYEPDPQQLAGAIYFHMKQHSENVKVDKAWGNMLKNIKNLLLQHFKWDMEQVHELFINLHVLTKYMKKTT